VADRMPPGWEDEIGRMLGLQDTPVTCRLVTGSPPLADPEPEELRHLAADLLELHEAGALAGIRAVVSERRRACAGHRRQGVPGCPASRGDR
jgi:hypothetical protein